MKGSKFAKIDHSMVQKAGDILQNYDKRLAEELVSSLKSITLDGAGFDSFVNALRDSAVALGKVDVNMAYGLISMAHVLRPSGSVITAKAEELKTLVQISKTGECQLDGLAMQFGEVPSSILLKALANGTYEKNEAILLKKTLEKNDIVLEVGAGIGYMGITAMKSGLCKRYVAYEANPDLIPLIENNMTNNGVKFEINNAVLLSKVTWMPFYLTPDFWASSLVKPLFGVYEEISIGSVNKNKVIKALEPTMLVIDIEGGEADFFKNINLYTIKKIILEIHPKVLSDEALSKLYSSLLSKGFILDFQLSRRQVLFWYRM